MMLGMLRFGFVGLMTGAVIVMYLDMERVVRTVGGLAVTNTTHTTQPGISSVSSHRSKTTSSIQKMIQPVQFNDEQLHHDDDTEAKRLAKKVRVLCLITTWPENLDSRAIHVKETWGKRCSILLFFSSVKNDSFPTIGLNVTEGRSNLNGKVMLAFRYIYEHYFDKADWFMKADDDTYVILENLRYFLSGENPDEPIYFGHHLKPRQTDEGFFSGGAGYVISKEALRRLGEKGFNKSICQQEGRKEDVYFARCMGKLNVKMGNSTDVLGRNRFHCLSPYFHISGRYSMWYRLYDIHGAKKVITARLPCGIT